MSEISIKLPSWLIDVWEILTGFLGLYKEPWFFAAIIFTFAFGQLIHIGLRAYMRHWRDVTKAFWIWSPQLIVGYFACQKFLDHLDDWAKYGWMCGISAIGFFYLFLAIGKYGIPLPLLKIKPQPWLYTFVTLKRSWLTDKNVIESGATIKFIAKGRK